jgi:hypothetical protein
VEGKGVCPALVAGIGGYPLNLRCRRCRGVTTVSEHKEAPLMHVHETQRLLAELRQLLTTYSVEPWASRVADLETRLHKAVASGKDWAVRATFADIAALLRGGPRTLHKVAIRKTLGDAIDEHEEETANARLSMLRTQLAAAIDRYAESMLA